MNESISALLDGECSPRELERLLDEMERNPALGEQFSRQCLARDARMGTKVRSAELNFSSRVLAALHEEQPGAVVVPFVARIRQVPWKAATGLAAAATIGAMAVLALKPESPAGAPAGLPVATTSPMPSAALAVPVSATSAPVARVAQDDLTRQQLQNYLRAYSQAREQQHMRSTLGYARYAAYSDAPGQAEPAAEPKR
jgi:negative regulator of sigma E activity